VSRLKKRFEQILEPADIQIDGNRPWDIRVNNDRVYTRVLARGTLGLGEAYMDGWWDCDSIDQMIDRAYRTGMANKIGAPTDVARIAKAKVQNLQRGRRSFEVGERHYDIGNDLYERMLDPLMMYSCGYWATADNLADAQMAKLELIKNKLAIEPGMRVLDIGCGWGGAAAFFAEHGCDVVGLTISVEQAKLARERCTDLPVDIRIQDYRELDEKFDRVYSIGMFEHVGVKNYKTYMDVVRRSLRDPDSLSLLHTIGGYKSSNRTDPWVEKYIFPNSMLPSAAQLSIAAERKLVIEDWHNFGPDYDRTLLEWFANIEASWGELGDRYDERFRRMWTFYLMTAAGNFRARANHLWQVVMSRDGTPERYAPPGIR
jgi:cyclopropane-fatty-acyl-phospholipid synthase